MKSVRPQRRLRSDHFQWNNYINDHLKNTNLSNLQDFRSCFNYEIIKRVYNWAHDFRAGIILYASNTKRILMVHQKPTDRFEKTRTMRRGFPKGGESSGDKSALDTAFRELYEETSIDLTTHDAQIAPQTFMIPRQSVGEMFIYFLCIIDHEPPVNICTTELMGYEWYDARASLRGIQSVTIPTSTLLNTLEDVDFDKISNTIYITPGPVKTALHQE